jgi:PPK2 family polyphosphate:nucleotide phosphotransferase
MSVLGKIAPKAPASYDKENTKAETEKLVKKLDELQNLLYAERKRSVLIVLQGMDASGKDGVIRQVFRGVNPMGCSVIPFKKPSEKEMAHDFLWRIHHCAPPKGMIHIFNRSHYEDVLIQRVHKWIDKDTVFKRFKHINSFEKLLSESGTTVLKFYLHISHEEQQERIKERISNPKKNWKYNPDDLKESQRWDEYMEAYEDVFEHCSPEIPWTVVPANQNWYKEHLIANTIVETLESFKMKYPGLMAAD